MVKIMVPNPIEMDDLPGRESFLLENGFCSALFFCQNVDSLGSSPKVRHHGLIGFFVHPVNTETTPN